MAVRANSSISRSIQCVSLNAKGLNNVVKRQKIVTYLQQLKTEIAFIQETHLKSNSVKYLKRKWVGQLFHSQFNVKARGTAILIHKDVAFEAEEVISDSNGRYVIVAGKLFSLPVILVNVYAPNFDDHNFFTNLFSAIPSYNNYNLIIGGDFNCVLNTTLDRSSTKPQSLTKSAKIINDFSIQSGLSDIWRFQNPNKKGFSFFSNVHHVYTRIDYFLIDNRLVGNVESCQYHAISVSDHGALSFQLNLPNCSRPSSHWRLNPLLLADEEFIEYISSQIIFFIETNTTPDVSHSTIWETLKAVLRGQIIEYSSRMKKTREAKLKDISQALADIDEKHSSSPSPDLYKERLRLQTEYDTLTTDKASFLLTKARHNFYEFGDKAGKLLAQQARQAASSRLIPKIIDGKGDIVTNQTEINNVFKQYYKDLYSSECDINTPKSDSFFDGLPFPTIPFESSSSLGGEISVLEILQAINSLKNNKTPGPDGFSSDFYKKFAPELSPLLQAMFNESLSSGQLPPTLRQAAITLIPKKGKDPLYCSSYRPISLLNVDYKILSKILAVRLEKLMPQIISTDQTGFILNRHSSSNLRRLLNIVYSSPACVPEMVISLDAEKAFDRVEWTYLFSTLKQFGFDETFISWIKLLYAQPLAGVITNGKQSEYFPLGRGTRQGCPLSPLLFAIAIEPLAIALRQSDDFSGIVRGGRTHKLSLYADDLLLYISNPITSVSSIVHILNQFGKISGYKINLQKSEVFPLNQAASQISPSHFPFNVVKKGFRYLGIEIPPTFSLLFIKNFGMLLEKCKQDMARWSCLPLSIVGRVNLIKMIVLPKFLYLFQNIPILIRKKIFKTLDYCIASFIWNGKPHRIKKQSLERPKELAGLALPNFMYYYWACNIQKMLFWMDDSDPERCEAWVHLESTSCSVHLGSVICASSLPTPQSHFFSNPIVLNSVKIWSQFRRHFNLSTMSVHSPIANNHSFVPSISDLAFKMWKTKGITTISDLFLQGSFGSFSQLSDRFDLPKSQFYRYLQIRHFVQKNFPSFPNRPLDNTIDKLLSLSPKQRGLISVIYHNICSISPQSLQGIRELWENDLGTVMRDDQWEAALRLVHTSSPCARHSLMQLKVILRIHWTAAKLAKVFPNVDPSCPRCKSQTADLLHMFWSCPHLRTYWADIFRAYSTMCSASIPPNPLCAIFGFTEETRSLKGKFHVVIAFTSLLARRLILLMWKDKKPPTFNRWIRDTMSFLKLEKIRYTLKGSIQSFERTWTPFLTYYRSLQSPLQQTDGEDK